MPNTGVEPAVIEVVAGVICREDSVLIARRPGHLHMGGLWEFPGGKREPGESVFDALQRELQEELGITIHAELPFMMVRHRYPDKHVLLDFRYVYDFDGEPCGREGQAVQWVERNALSGFAFPEANCPVVARLQSV